MNRATAADESGGQRLFGQAAPGLITAKSLTPCARRVSRAADAGSLSGKRRTLVGVPESRSPGGEEYRGWPTLALPETDPRVGESPGPGMRPRTSARFLSITWRSSPTSTVSV